MNSIDLIIIIPVIVGFIFGLFKGLIKELTSLAAIVLGIYGAKTLSPHMKDILMRNFDVSLKTAQPLAYIILFVTIAVLLLIIAKSLDKFFDSIALGGLNKFLGGIFGGLKYALIISVVMNVFNAIDSKFNFVKPETKLESFAYKPILILAPKLWDEVHNNNLLNKHN